MKFSQGATEKVRDAESVENTKVQKIECIENHFMCKDEGSLTGSQVCLCKDKKVIEVLPSESQKITEQRFEDDKKVSENLDEPEQQQEDYSTGFFLTLKILLRTKMLPKRRTLLIS